QDLGCSSTIRLPKLRHEQCHDRKRYGQSLFRRRGGKSIRRHSCRHHRGAVWPSLYFPQTVPRVGSVRFSIWALLGPRGDDAMTFSLSYLRDQAFGTVCWLIATSISILLTISLVTNVKAANT